MSHETSRRCPCCGTALDKVEDHDSRMTFCPHCGRLCLEGNNLAHTIQNLHLKKADMQRAFSDLRAILRRRVNRHAR